MKVDFYILEEMNTRDAWLSTCRLIEKLHAMQANIYIHINSHEEAQHLDQLLWTYREDGFLAHNIYSESDVFPPSIQIGYSNAPSQQTHLLINLSHKLPDFYGQFANIAEIVFPDPHMQQLARERYRQYRDQGTLPQTHKIKINEL